MKELSLELIKEELKDFSIDNNSYINHSLNLTMSGELKYMDEAFDKAIHILLILNSSKEPRM